MQEFKIEPHIGIGPAKLGASRDEIRAAFATVGFPLEAAHGRSDYFCDSAIQVESGEDGRAHFIGANSNRTCSVTYHGVNVFDTPADLLFTLIAEKEGSGSHLFKQSEYLFPNQIVTLWDADEQYDRLGGESRMIWGQVGLGDEDYLKAISRIRSRVS